MASSTLQKLLRNQTRPASTFFTHFQKPLSPSPPFVLTQIPKPNKPSPDQFETDHFNPKHSFSGHVYPTFSFEFLLNPIAPPSLIQFRPESDGEENDRDVIRADSTKKKRRRKMRKHKIKKRMKALRRKSRS